MDDRTAQSDGKAKSPCVALREWLHAFFATLPSEILNKRVEFLTLVIAVISVALLLRQLWDLNDTLESQAYSYIAAGLTELDKAGIENSDLRKYFVANVALDQARSDSERTKILALADAKLDFMDSTYTQFEHIDPKHYTGDAWDEYFEQSFKCSAVLRELYCSETGQYGHNLQTFVGKKFPSGMCDGKKAKAFSPDPDYCSE